MSGWRHYEYFLFSSLYYCLFSITKDYYFDNINSRYYLGDGDVRGEKRIKITLMLARSYKATDVPLCQHLHWYLLWGPRPSFFSLRLCAFAWWGPHFLSCFSLTVIAGHLFSFYYNAGLGLRSLLWTLSLFPFHTSLNISSMPITSLVTSGWAASRSCPISSKLQPQFPPPPGAATPKHQSQPRCARQLPARRTCSGKTLHFLSSGWQPLWMPLLLLGLPTSQGVAALISTQVTIRDGAETITEIKVRTCDQRFPRFHARLGKLGWLEVGQIWKTRLSQRCCWKLHFLIPSN